MSGATGWVPSLWKDTFDELLNDDNELDYGDEWNLNFNYSLTDKLSNEEKKRGWKIHCNSSFGNFQCGSCKKTWGSAKVIVLFHYRLRGDRGTVLMRPFGQACRSCQDDEFYRPGFSQKVVEETLLRLISKIRKNCYGDEDDDSDGGSSTGTTKVFTKPHEASLCEACIKGVCSQDND